MIKNSSQLRSTIFRHLDGLATAPVAVALNKKGILIYNEQEIVSAAPSWVKM